MNDLDRYTTRGLERMQYQALRAVTDAADACIANSTARLTLPYPSPAYDDLMAAYRVRHAAMLQAHEHFTAISRELEARITAEDTAPGITGGTTGNGTRYCRTCGFTDCEGASTGNCPRWPANA